ncbi:MAG: hypothetical protein AB7H43_02090 [Acidimicrobiia bacterium]
MSSFVGNVTLVAERERREHAGVGVTLASTDERWFGTVQGEVEGLLDGDVVVVRLPSGLEGRAEVVIDLTGPDPAVRLRGVGRPPL